MHLRNCPIVPDVTMVGERVCHIAQFPFFCILQRINRLIFDLLLQDAYVLMRKLVTCTMGWRGDFVSTSIFALVHLAELHDHELCKQNWTQALNPVHLGISMTTWNVESEAL